MKLLDFLKRGPRVKPLPPIKTVQAPGQERKDRLEQERMDPESGGADEQLSVAPPDDIKLAKVDPAFEDTGSLELTAEPDEAGNPYDTQSWQLDPRKGMRRVDNLKAINREPVDEEVVSNPYDTGIVRKGW